MGIHCNFYAKLTIRQKAQNQGLSLCHLSTPFHFEKISFFLGIFLIVKAKTASGWKQFAKITSGLATGLQNIFYLNLINTLPFGLISNH